MKKLTQDWLTEGTLDFEYKKYLLLAYLQDVSREFAEMRLYPPFADLIGHYQNLASLKDRKKELIDQFPKELDTQAARKLQLSFSSKIEADDNMRELDAIIDFSIPAIRSQLEEGREIYSYIDEQITIEPIGITPLYKNEGYLLVSIRKVNTVKAFEYRIIFFENTEGNYYGISLDQVDEFSHTLANTFEAMKLRLVRSHAKLPNPATYLIHCRMPFPEKYSLLPVTKRKFLAYMK